MSATDELCEMLTGRCEEFFVNDFGVNWRYYSDPHTATESMDGTLIVTGLTPAQAVIATLGRGTMTAEQVQELMESNSHQYQSLTDPYVYLTEYDWQAIADELNGMLNDADATSERQGGAGTCHDVAGIDDVFECSACGGRYQAWAIKRWARYCPDCGRRFIREGE